MSHTPPADGKHEKDERVEQVAPAKEKDDGEVAFVYDAEMERKLVRKLDMRILPTLWVMYWLNYLDRNNIGNAKTAGMAKDLKLSSSDYSLAVSIFFVGYLCLQIPSNMIISRTRPRLYLPFIEFVWGCIVIGFLGVNTKGGLIGIRFCLGIVEAGFFPGALLYMSIWYKKHELARRYAAFYSASLLAGAFGGLLAGAILSGLGGRSGLPAWKWLFLIEGCMTVFFSFIAVWILPDWPGNTAWLSPAERAYAVARLQAERTVDVSADASNQSGVTHWRAFVLAVKDWRVWLVCFAQCMGVAAGTIVYFIPTLTAALGYAGRKAQFMTVPLYAVALVMLIATSFFADHFKERPMHIMGISMFAVVSCAIVAGVDSNAKVRYAFLAFALGGIQTGLLLNFVVLGNSFGKPAEKRAVAIAMVNALANLSSVYGSYIWPAYSAPRYIPGFVTTSMFMFGLFLCAAAYKFIVPRFPEKGQSANTGPGAEATA